LEDLLRDVELEDRTRLTTVEEKEWDLDLDELREVRRELKDLEQEPAPHSPAAAREPKLSPQEIQLALERVGGERIRAIDYHEAGHAVAFVLKGIKLHEVTVTWRRCEDDRLEVTGAYCRSRDGAGCSAVVDLGGIAPVELAGLGEALPPEGSKGDWRRGSQAKGCAPHRLAPDLRAAKNVFRANWPAVLPVASALMQRGWLSGADAERIIIESITRRDSPTFEIDAMRGGSGSGRPAWFCLLRWTRNERRQPGGG
jgi:hypothetical protein